MPGYPNESRDHCESVHVKHTARKMQGGHEPPMIATTPRLTSGVAKTASSLAMTMSQLSTISVPPPYVPPFTAAIIGLQDDCLREMEPKPFTCTSTSLHSLSGVFVECARLFHLQAGSGKDGLFLLTIECSRVKVCTGTKRLAFAGHNDHPARPC